MIWLNFVAAIIAVILGGVILWWLLWCVFLAWDYGCAWLEDLKEPRT